MLQFKILLLYYSLSIAAERIRKEAGLHNLQNGWKEKELVPKVKKKFSMKFQKMSDCLPHLPRSYILGQKFRNGRNVLVHPHYLVIF